MSGRDSTWKRCVARAFSAASGGCGDCSPGETGGRASVHEVRAANERRERPRGKRKSPATLSNREATHLRAPMMRIVHHGVQFNPRQRPTLPRTYARSTIGGSRLNFRVRNGNGCDPAPMTTGKLFANLEDRTLRCPGDFPGAASSNAPNSATWRLGVHLRLARRSAWGEGGSSQNMSVEYSAMSATLTSRDREAEASRYVPSPVARVFRPATR